MYKNVHNSSSPQTSVAWQAISPPGVLLLSVKVEQYLPRVKSRELSVCSCQEIGFDISIPSSYIICRSRPATVGAQDLMQMPHRRSAESRENPKLDENFGPLYIDKSY